MSARSSKDRIRVLVIDDSAYNRQAIAEMLESDDGIDVVGRSANGEEGLKEALSLKPDVITLDLEMPKMDGFTFLRIIMSRQPTPVIVISSYSRKQNVFKALELGALDFIAKPTRYLSPELHKICDELVEKVLMVRHLRTSNLQVRATQWAVAERQTVPQEAQEEAGAGAEIRDMALVVVGASTGGPPALQTLLQTLPRHLPVAYLVAQHMPENFTRAFSDRLNRYTGLEVSEARGGEVVEPGRVFVAPGGKNLKVVRQGATLKTEVEEVEPDAKYVPSIDAMFLSAAEAMGDRAMGVLLTGMGSDGRNGIQAIKQAGGRTVAESEETAVIFGMPKEAIESGGVDTVLRLDEIAGEVVRFAEEACRPDKED
jgi:two-component system chemotaxis response regulator CheB